MSLAYANSPVTFGTASLRLTTSPTRPSSSSVFPCNSLLLGASNPARAAGSSAERPCNSLLLGIGEGHGGADGVEDLRVPGAATKVPGKRLAELVLAGRRVVLEQVGGRTAPARRAEAALHGTGLRERLLHGVQLALPREALDRDDVVAVGLRSEDEARAGGVAGGA